MYTVIVRNGCESRTCRTARPYCAIGCDLARPALPDNRKLLTMLNAMVRTNTPWDNSLHRA
ncbi:MAG: hypothetical protein EPN70_16790 [Paraburkholderia sp.]|nr:MAG: hypothetical protein EPN70_16790 [Paraburkholderia sp.]TAM28101.1 MAG: hypothetical protein EPN59_18220 [Paraburkholderia sp.]